MSLSLENMEAVARAMVTPGKGILAADESSGTIKKRFDTIGVESTEANRNAYRDLLFTSPGMNQYINGVIMFDETFFQSSLQDGIPYPQYLETIGVIPGIKVDKGAHPLAGSETEKITSGLDGLDERLQNYRKHGARFAKWRAVITIDAEIPTGYCINTNAHALARYAALCQKNDIVPIVEPEVLMDGTHTIEESFEITEEVLHTVFFELYSQGVVFEEMVLKPNMVLSGYDCPEQADVDTVALQTIQCLKRCVPAAVPGIAFLSGGQDDVTATKHLNRMNQLLKTEKPWNLTFSYGRALQAPALKAWGGVSENVGKAQEAFLKRARLNSAATLGDYSSDME